MSEVDPFIGYGPVEDGATSRHAQHVQLFVTEGAGFPMRSVSAAHVTCLGGTVAMYHFS
jgi:hypothetical protein